MLWNVEGADSKTGEDQIVVIEAASEEDAAATARKRGIFVSRVRAAKTAAIARNPSQLFPVLAIAAVIAIGISGGLIWKALSAKPPLAPSVSLNPSISAVTAAPAPSVGTPNELAKLREQNAELAQKLADISDKLEKLSVPPAAAASPPPAPVPINFQSSTVKGSAWLNHNGGQSDLLRGLKVIILPTVVPREAAAAVLRSNIDDWKSFEADAVKQVDQDRELQIAADDSEKDVANCRQQQIDLQQMIARLPAQMTTQSLYSLAMKTQRFNLPMFLPVDDAVGIKSTTTDVNGAFSIPDLPPGDYLVHARLDTSSVYIEWLVPIESNGSIVSVDLFNDNAAKISNP